MRVVAKVVVRPATREDIAKAAEDMEATPTVKAWVGELREPGEEPRVLAIGGLHRIGGRWKIFLDHTDEAKAYPMHLMRWARRVMAEARAMGLARVYAQIDPDEPGAVKWVESLGFRFDERTEFYWCWHADENPSQEH